MKAQILSFFSAVTYIKHQDKDCLMDNNIHEMDFYIAMDYDNCTRWCTDHDDCGGFTVYRNTAYFKNLSCKSALYTSFQKIVFIKHTN